MTFIGLADSKKQRESSRLQSPVVPEKMQTVGQSELHPPSLQERCRFTDDLLCTAPLETSAAGRKRKLLKVSR